MIDLFRPRSQFHQLFEITLIQEDWPACHLSFFIWDWLGIEITRLESDLRSSRVNEQRLAQHLAESEEVSLAAIRRSEARAVYAEAKLAILSDQLPSARQPFSEAGQSISSLGKHVG
ncbi:unnamed protein product [Protopolystoma xenopodis]|uniref:Uncharacterized protein n=1 Tax=Protopolystoma xenopodis TaxID=117903 RepID=A0A3S5CDQ4_9PLAT|nr:unnamed protein product [Protopolystoma xenopodis]